MNKALRPEAMVAVIGAGTMGAGIAEVAAAAGHPVRLFDNRDGAAAEALVALGKRLQQRVERGKLDAAARSALRARLSACATLEEVAPAALVIEAIVENLEVKRQVFHQLEALVGAQAILASNTSSLSITEIGAALERPERLVGMHFFNPVPLMALVEVIAGLASDGTVVDTVLATAAAWGKRPVRATSTPGFIVNRVARPFYAEALRLLQEGVAEPATIDAIVRDCGGFRMGPFELMDLIGLDVNFAVTNSVFAAFFQDPRYRPSLLQQELVAAGRLGRKNGQGFYTYAEGAGRPAVATAGPAPAPGRVVVHGDLGVAAPLVGRLSGSGIALETVAGQGPGWLEIDGSALALTDGRSATRRSADAGRPWVLFDLALDFAAAGRVALAPADQAGSAELAAATGLFQALGMAVSVLDDTPGMVLMRTVCLLANEGVEAVLQQVCSASGVDEAMRGGVNYPRGPLAWGDAIGPVNVLAVLDALVAAYGEERYRASSLLRRKVAAGRPLLD